MRNLKIIFYLIIISTFACTPLFAANNLKIGIINFQKIFDNSEKGKAISTKLEKEGRKLSDELKKTRESIEKKKQDIERQKTVLSKEALVKKQERLNKEFYQYLQLREKYTAEFKIKEQKMLNEIKQELFKLVGSYAKKRGYTVILETREAGVIYADNAVDITDRIVRLYDIKQR